MQSINVGPVNSRSEFRMDWTIWLGCYGHSADQTSRSPVISRPIRLSERAEVEGRESGWGIALSK
ncbi:MAG: hypothetical protein CMM07_27525 [Rhodopirellula sp.]|nr:hypothetical protein [Rhodopirellula sp.]